MDGFTLRLFLLIGALLALSLAPAPLPAAPPTPAAGEPVPMRLGCGGTKRPTPAGPVSKTWDNDADFQSGDSQQTEVVSGTGRLSVERRWSATSPVDAGPPPSPMAPQLAIDDNEVLYSAWQATTSQGGVILVARSLDGGDSWGQGIQVNLGASALSAPVLAAAGSSTLYVAWIDDRSGKPDVYVARSLDGGQTWGPNIPANDANGPLTQSTLALAAAPGGKLALAWQDGRRGNADIYTARSTNGGQSWEPNARANDDPGSASQADPSLALSLDGTLYLAWQDLRQGNADIYTTRSTNGGATWQANVRANDDSGSAFQLDPIVTVDQCDSDGSKVYVVWQDGRGGSSDIYVAASGNRGQSWGANVKVNSKAPGAGPATTPSLTLSADRRLVVAWLNHEAQQAQIYTASSFDGGATWMSAEPLNADLGDHDQNHPSLIAGSQGKLYALWYENQPGGSGLEAAQWPDNTHVFTDGIYTALHDASAKVAWTDLSWSGELPQGTAVTITVRSGNPAGSSVAWSPWYTLAGSPASLQALPPGRYVQWRAHLSAPDGKLTPVLDTLTVRWRLLVYLPLIE